MIVTRAISVTNFLVASSALGFQVGVLYPWHKQLDDDFEALKKEHMKVLGNVEDKVTVPRGAPSILEQTRKAPQGILNNLAMHKA